MSAAASMAPGSPYPMQADPRASVALWAPDDSSPPDLLSHRYPQLATQFQEPVTIHLSETQAPGFAIPLMPGGFLPHRAQRPNIPPLTLSVREPLLPCQRVRMTDSSQRYGSYTLVFCRQHQKPCSTKEHRCPALHAAPPCRRVTFLLSKNWNHSSSTERQSTTLLVLGGCPIAQRPNCRRQL
jgi:hypothetical protein